MEKLFSWRILIAISAIFIVTWISLQIVSNLRVSSEAEIIADQIFNWDWPTENWQSRTQITNSEVLKRSDTDACVKVFGKQKITTFPPGERLDIKNGKSETIDCQAVLSLYKRSNKWVLGKLELD